MSLRARLLLAAGGVALVALVIADVVTYQELRSFLHQRTDQSLVAVQHALQTPRPGAPGGGGAGGGGPGGGGSGPAEPGAPGAGDTASTATSRPGETSTRTSITGSSNTGSSNTGSSNTGSSNTGSSNTATGGGATTSCNGMRGVPDDLFAELPPGSFIELRSSSGSVLCRSVQPQLDSPTPGAPVLPDHITGLTPDAGAQDVPDRFFTASTSSGSVSYEMRASTIPSGPFAGDQLVVGAPLGPTQSTLDRLLLVELAVTGAALVAAVLIGWWLVRLGLAPLRSVEATAGAIARGELAERVPGEEAKTEVGRLARALNVMLSRIEGAFAQRDATEHELRQSERRMRRFVADASHELRTPLTAVSAYAELFEQGASARADDLERVMHGIRAETARMGHLVEDLLLLARLDEGRPLQHDDIDLVEMVADAIRTATTVGPAWPVRLEAHEPVDVSGDRMRLRQVIDNLLSNVRTHCPEGTSTVVEIAKDADSAVVTVTDDGPGLDEEHAGRVFERFFRLDPSRSRLHGGSGLGLAIVQSIVEAHGGSVAATPGPGGGTSFTVRLPLGSQDEGDEEPSGPEAAAGRGAGGIPDSQETHT